MKSVTIYTINGETLTEGLRSAAVCDEAIQAARELARDRGEVVVVEDPDGCEPGTYTVGPDGSRGAAPADWPEA